MMEEGGGCEGVGGGRGGCGGGGGGGGGRGEATVRRDEGERVCGSGRRGVCVPVFLHLLPVRMLAAT